MKTTPVLRRDPQTVDLRQIKLFVAVAEDRDYGRAAQRMHITQREAPHHIRRLERALGEQLVERSSRQVRLTPAGEAFREVAQRLLRQAHGARVPDHRFDEEETRGLRLGGYLPVVAPVLSVLLGHWSRRQPAVRPWLTSGRSEELLDLVRRRELDVALVDGPVDDGSLSSVLVLEHQLVMDGHRATLPLVAVSAGEGITAETQEFLVLIDALRHGSRFLPITTVDLTDPPRALQPVA